MRGLFFANHLRKLRMQQGETLESLAKKCGTHKGYISGIENGKVNPPSAKLVRKLSDRLGGNRKHMLLIAWVDKAPKDIRQYLVEQLLCE